MTNDDLKRFYPQNSTPEKSNDFVRYNANGEIPGVGGNGGEHETVIIDALPTATQGTITQEQLTTLQKNDANTLLFADEIYRLSDKRTSEGYLIYSHACQDNTDNFYIKCITITISTLGWVLTSLNSASKEDFDKLVNNETQIKSIDEPDLLMAGGGTSRSGSKPRKGIAIGNGASVHTTGCVAIGKNAKTNNSYSMAIGESASTDQYGVAVGGNAEAKAHYSVAIGYNAKAKYGGSSGATIQISAGTNSTPNTLQVKDDNIYNFDTHTLTVQNIELNGKKLENKYLHHIILKTSNTSMFECHLVSSIETPFNTEEKLVAELITQNYNSINYLAGYGISSYAQLDNIGKIFVGIYPNTANNSLYTYTKNINKTTKTITVGEETFSVMTDLSIGSNQALAVQWSEYTDIVTEL